ncbi:MAG: lipoyl(octanoyl) transferase LipB [Gammaproteobacteria bacterium]|nr:lipoyl(octanoyl) transferase LipB [Gammaproteobacteria bacterium]
MQENPGLKFKDLGLADYRSTWAAMQAFTDNRNPQTDDEIWMLEHPPVFTVGLNGDMQHVLNAGDIPVIRIDRGGQVTYHGPGQLVVYPLIDLKRRKLGVRALVSGLEQAVVTTLAHYGIEAASRPDAPGVYVSGRKIASLGLRIRRGCSYHGLAFNVDMDLEPFSRINPCGFDGLEVTSLANLGGPSATSVVARILRPCLQELFSA